MTFFETTMSIAEWADVALLAAIAIGSILATAIDTFAAGMRIEWKRAIDGAKYWVGKIDGKTVYHVYPFPKAKRSERYRAYWMLHDPAIDATQAITCVAFVPTKKMAIAACENHWMFMNASSEPETLETVETSAGQTSGKAWTRTTDYPDGSKKSESFVGKRRHADNGPAVWVTYPDGKPCVAEYWQNGMRHRNDGPAIVTWYPSGMIASEESWRNGAIVPRNRRVWSVGTFAGAFDAISARVKTIEGHGEIVGWIVSTLAPDRWERKQIRTQTFFADGFNTIEYRNADTSELQEPVGGCAYSEIAPDGQTLLDESWQDGEMIQSARDVWFDVVVCFPYADNENHAENIATESEARKIAERIDGEMRADFDPKSAGCKNTDCSKSEPCDECNEMMAFVDVYSGWTDEHGEQQYEVIPA